MYEIKDKSKLSIMNISEMARKIGVDRSTLCRIFNRKQKCSKIMAYAIVKSINEKLEIDDYFERVE
jgi:plasmid maintenance system antidote protein VapI